MTTLTDITETPLSGLNHIDALLDTGPDWNFASTGANLISYTFSTTAGLEANSASSYNSGSLRTFNASQQAAARTALADLSSLTGIVFVETNDGLGAALHFAAADLVGATTTGLTSWNATYSRNPATDAVTNYRVNDYVYLDNVQFSSRNTNPAPGTSGYETLLHELGHALGLKHPFEGDPTLPAAEDSSLYTLMSYDHVGGPYATFRPYDVAALNWLYGRDGLGGDLGIGSTTGARYITGTAGADSLTGTAWNDTLRGDQGNDTINGGAGTDTAVFSGLSTAYVFRELGNGMLGVTGADGSDSLISIEWLQFSDRLISRASLADTTAPTAPVLKLPLNLHGYAASATPEFLGKAEANTAVDIYSGQLHLASAVADVDGNYRVRSGVLGEGSIAAYAIATDSAGNVSAPSALLNFKVDVTAPSVPTATMLSGAGTLISGNQAIFSGTAEAHTTLRLVDSAANGAVVLGSAVVGDNGSWSLTTAPMVDGAHQVTAQSVDDADHITSANGTISFSVLSSLNRSGSEARDTLSGTSGNNAINALGGIDTMVYAGSAASYTVVNTGNGFTVTGAASGTDSLVNVERIAFGDKHIAIDIDGHAGQAYRLFGAAFDRAPRLTGLGFYIDALDNNVTLDSIADQFLHSAEFVTKFGANDSNEQFLTRLYDYVLDRPPGGEGYQFWLHALNDLGVPRAHVLAQFSESAENRANVVGLIGNGVEYQLWQG